MSAYVCEKETWGKIAANLQWIRNGQYIRGHLSGYFREPNYPTGQEMSALVIKMAELNCKSVDLRYRLADTGNPEIPTEQEANGIVAQAPLAKPIEILKALQCYLYQSCEGGCNKDPLFVALDKVKDSLAFHIVTDLPEYNKAKWG